MLTAHSTWHRGAKLQAKLNRVQAEAQEKQTQLAKDIEDARAIATASAARAAEAEAKLATLAQGSEQFDQSEAALKAEIAVLSAQVRPGHRCYLRLHELNVPCKFYL